MSVAPPYRRGGFLASLSAAAFAPLAVGASPAEDPIRQSPISVSHALILIGGGYRLGARDGVTATRSAHDAVERAAKETGRRSRRHPVSTRFAGRR
jgi:hypothetical protein